MRTLIASAILLFSCCAVAVAEPPPPLIIRNVTVIDVEQGRSEPSRDVVLRDGLIAELRPAGSALLDGAEVIDATGLYLIPGLFDAHVHYVTPDSFGPLMIANGVTFVRDLGNATDVILSTRDRLNSGELLGPRMICTGAIIDGKDPIWPFSEECDTPEQARAAVRKLKDAGVDQIKVYSKLKPEVYRAAVEEAHALGLKAVGHIPSACTPADAAAVKQDSVEHLSRFEAIIAELAPDKSDARAGGGMFAQLRAWARLDEVDPAALDARLKALADAGVVQCPTIVVLAGIGALADGGAADDPLLRYIPAELRSFWAGGDYKNWAEQAAQMVAPMQKMIARLHAAGVPLMIGTDLANPYVFPGFSVHREMALWAEAGIPAPDILRPATIVPARFCGVGDRYGSIAPGKAASLVLLEADPLADIRNVSKIRAVFFEGAHFDRARLDALLKSVSDAVAAAAPADDAEVVLTLPGEVVARGRYAATFGQFDAGEEEFLITRDADGYHIMAHNQPKGGFAKPSVSTLHVGPDFSFHSASYRELTKASTQVEYSLDGRTFRAAPSGGEPQTLEAPEGALFAPSAYIADFATLLAAGLEPGQTKSLTIVGYGWGQPTWKIGTVPMDLTRHEDTELDRSGVKTPVRRYTSTIKTPMGTFESETWTDLQGVPLKSVLVMPFGTLTVELQ